MTRRQARLHLCGAIDEFDAEKKTFALGKMFKTNGFNFANPERPQ
jgi:hypothetical protein